MIRVAIVEDEEGAYRQLESSLNKFSSERHVDFSTTHFSDAVSFLDDYKGCYEIVFMDIQMPYLNGMKAAEKLRQIDTKVTLVFVTNLTQYAIGGYAVDAKDYILKPVQYNRFACMMDRILSSGAFGADEDLFVKNGGNLYRIRLSEIRYIEIKDHYIVYHLYDRDFTSWGTMKEIEEKLAGKNFCRLDKSTIVNFAHVTEIAGDEVRLNFGETLYISRPRKKEVKQKFYAYVENS